MVQIITNNSGGGGGVGVYKYKGSVDYYEDLPTSGMKIGDTYNVVNAFTKDGKEYPAGTNVAWTGTDWDALGGSIDLSDYQKKLVEGNGIDIDQDTNEISVDTSVIATKQDLTTKQDTISDLETIRQGAAKGATSIQPNDNISALNNNVGYITGISGSDVTNALGYTPYNSTNPSGYIDKDVNDLTNYTKTEDLPDFTTYQLKSNMVTSLNSADDTHYPTAKAVKDAISSAGGGDVSGPSSSVDGHLAVFDGTTGKIIKDGGAIPTPTTVVDNLNSTSATSALSANQGNVLKGITDTINGKIPSEASSSNKLADKNYVDDSINQVAAYYITRTAAGDAFATKAQLLATTTFYSGGTTRTPTRNDYCIVLADETHNGETTRYSYQGSSWEYQYTVNETALTQQQVDALNSGITSTKVGQYDTAVTTIAGYGDIVTHNASEFATSAQGGKADSALQPNDNISELNNDAGYITGVAWGSVSGTLSNQVDLQNALNAKANDSGVVHTTGAETINGTKTFGTSPVVPSKTTAATNTGTAIATEAQVYKKQDTISDLATIRSGASAGATAIQPNDNVSSLTNDAGYLTSSTGVTTVNGNHGAVTVQATLVSGTNIKTVNSTSLLGSGNIAVQPTLVSGTNIKTINGKSILGSGNITVSSSTTTTCTLTSAGWSSNSQTVSATGVTASNTVIVSPAPSDIGDYADKGVYCSAQGSGTLTFGCDEAPSGDIVVNVLIMS